MAVAVTVDVPGGTEQQYQQITATIFPGGKLPEGWLVHLAGPTENGWRVINVVPSQDEFEAFARERLLPPPSRQATRRPRSRSSPSTR